MRIKDHSVDSLILFIHHYTLFLFFISYMDDLDRIFTSGYVPTLQDVLRVRIATTGIIEYTFNMRKDVIFRYINITCL